MENEVESKNVFEDLKSKIKQYIINNIDKEITLNSKNENIGIYLLYIDNFDDDKILPIYIGQTGLGKGRNFQKRYEEHLKEIMALNRLHCSIYKFYLLEGFYEGNYKACKIFKYMVDHHCSLKDFHMIELERVSTETENLEQILNQKEQEYFSRYLPSFFGFNQLNSFNERVKLSMSFLQHIKKYHNRDFEHIKNDENILCYELEDCNNFIKYFGYGYTKFNYYYCYNIDKCGGSEELKAKKEWLKSRFYKEDRFMEYKKEIPSLELKHQQVECDIKKYDDLFESVYVPKIKEYCLNNNISIIHKYDEIIRAVKCKNDMAVDSFAKYLKRKKIAENIIETLNNDLDFQNFINTYFELLNEDIQIRDKIKEYKNIEKIDSLTRLLPSREYETVPLKDMYQEIKFKDIKENSLIINFEFSNHGGIMQSTFLTKVDYKLNVDNNILEKRNIFITPETKLGNDLEDYYYEKGFGSFYNSPFNISRINNNISVAMEIKNGINDYTIMNNETINFTDVLDEINQYINNETEVKILYQNRMKNVCKSFIRVQYKKNNILKQKLLSILTK